MKYLLCLTLCAFSIDVYSQNQDIEISFSFDSEKDNELGPGEVGTLKWDVSGSDNVFISYLGKVENNGQAQFSPENSVFVTLLAQRGGFSRSRTIRIVRIGSRGNDYCPVEEDYSRFSSSFTTSAPDYSLLFSSIHALLQDSLGFNIKHEYQTLEKLMVFETFCARRDYLTESEKINRRDEHRVAYRIEFQRANTNKLTYTINCALLYRKPRIRAWRKETDADIHNSESKELRKIIETVLDKL